GGGGPEEQGDFRRQQGLTRVPLAAAALAALALLATLIAFSGNGRAQAQPVLD
ncbi:hypothetical protein, partial [Pseudomonas aeruginosa]|uniref:hypothetical protein n=1 Tax=Pseudomonas aeruginosa TaxID=287 RepID=UPI00187A8FE3